MTTGWPHPTAFFSWDHEERAAIARVHASGRYTMAGETEQFEHELAAYHGRAHAIAVNSGSSANLVAVAAAKHHLILKTEGYADADQWRTYVPALAWATTYAPLIQHNFDLTVTDIDDTWNALALAKRWVSVPPNAYFDIIIGCSILGNPAHLLELREWADHKGTILLEDNCEALGARTQDGRLTGTFGHLSTESFFYSHQISAIELGAILTDDPDLARLCRLLRNHGNSGWGQDDFDRLYNFEVFGFNVRPTEMHCAVARAQLHKLDGFVQARRENDAYFRVQTNNLLSVTHPRLTSPHTSPFGLAFRVETPQQRRTLVANLRAQGIDCRPPTGGSFTRHPYGAPWRDQPTPAADLIHDAGLFLGNPPWPAQDLVDRAVKVLRETL